MAKSIAPLSLRRLLAVVVSVSLVVSSCGGVTGTGAKKATRTPIDAPASSFVDKTNTETLNIEIKGNQYRPPYVVITAGTKVTWTVTEDATHNVLPIDDGAFAPSGDLVKDDSYSLTFGEAGEFGYYCSHHGSKTLGQRGGLRVVAAR